MTKLYLKPNAVLEPLLWNWHAWAHLMSPLTASMHIKNRHIRVMERFVSSGNVRVGNQKFEGGPVVQLDVQKIGDVQQLLDKTLSECSGLIALAEAIEDASAKAYDMKGYSLEALYKDLKPSIRGLVELVYDLNFNAGLRFYEKLAWLDYYSTQAQSISFSSLTCDKRPFILGTPVVSNDQNVIVSLPFSSHIIDTIQRSSFHGVEAELLKESLCLNDFNFKKIIGFFDTEPTISPSDTYRGDGTRVRYYGHACLLFECNNLTILIDPLISYSYSADLERFTFSDLPERIDYVLITHAHQDHFSIETLLKIKNRVVNIVVPRNNKGDLADPSLKLILAAMGFENIIEVDELDVIALPDGQISTIPFIGEHAELDIQSKIAYCLEIHDTKYFAGADLNNVDTLLYARAFKEAGSVDVMFIGMECDGGPIHWLYGPLITRKYDKLATKTRTLSGSNCEKAISLVNQLKPTHVYVYSMGEEPWLNYIMNIDYSPEALQIVESDKFVRLNKSSGIASCRLYGKHEWFFK